MSATICKNEEWGFSIEFPGKYEMQELPIKVKEHGKEVNLGVLVNFSGNNDELSAMCSFSIQKNAVPSFSGTVMEISKKTRAILIQYQQGYYDGLLKMKGMSRFGIKTLKKEISRFETHETLRIKFSFAIAMMSSGEFIGGNFWVVTEFMPVWDRIYKISVRSSDSLEAAESVFEEFRRSLVINTQ